MRLKHITHQLYEVELVDPENEHREPIIGDFFHNMLNRERRNAITFYSKSLRTLTSMKNLKNHLLSLSLSLSLYLATSAENLEDVILSEKREQWKAMRSRDCTDNFSRNARDDFFPGLCCNTHKKHDKREPGLFNEEVRCTEKSFLCSKLYCCYDWKSYKYKFSSKCLNKRTLKNCSDGPMSKYRKVPDESFNITSINRRLQLVQQSAATYELTKKKLSCFCCKRIVEKYGLHTKSLQLWSITLILCVLFCPF